MIAGRLLRSHWFGGLAAGALAVATLGSAPSSAASVVIQARAVPVSAVASVPAPASGRTFRVSTVDQLRRAVAASNRSQGTDRIRLNRDIRFTRGSAGGDLDISDDLVIEGRGRTIDANSLDRIFDISARTRVVLKGINLRNGQPAKAESGGAVRSKGKLVVRNSTISDSMVRGEGASGGAIVNDGGALTVISTTLTRNRAERAGGAIEAVEGVTKVLESSLTRNRTGAEPGNGGALHLTGAGRVRVKDSLVERNVASAEGGGLWNSAEGRFLIQHTRIRANRAGGKEADNGGGGVYNDGGSLRLTNSRVIGNSASGASGSGGALLNNAGDVRVADTVLKRNSASRAGGAIESNLGFAYVLDCDFLRNSTGEAPGNGGAIHLTDAGRVRVESTNFRRNFATKEGGALWNSATGTFELDSSTLTRNRADDGENDIHNDGGTFTVTDGPS